MSRIELKAGLIVSNTLSKNFLGGVFRFKGRASFPVSKK